MLTHSIQVESGVEARIIVQVPYAPDHAANIKTRCRSTVTSTREALDIRVGAL